MSSRLVALSFAASDPLRLGRFWAGVLGWESTGDLSKSVELLPNDDTGFRLRFQPSREAKTGPNQMHFDLTSVSDEHQQQTVARSLGLGARHIDVGQLPGEGHVVLADPEGNEFCVIEPGNQFLSDCGFIGAVASDGSRKVGQFWSDALGWPLVWDQGEETAIRSPHGGPKLTWGGVPAPPTPGNSRLHLEIAPTVDGEWQSEVARLALLGAGLDGLERDESGWVMLTDPDGNEFRMLTRGQE